jgi:hypothetical protein
MEYPVIFPVRVPFAGRSPEQVRQIATTHGFWHHEAPRTAVLTNDRMRGFSEIWYKLALRGYAIIRIDTQGHAILQRQDTQYAIGGISPGPHGAVPHYQGQSHTHPPVKLGRTGGRSAAVQLV